MTEKPKFEDVKYVLSSIAVVAALACCVSFSKAATIVDTASQNEEVEEIVVSVEDEEVETALAPEIEEKDCDKAIESIQEQSARIDDGMSEIQKDLEELKKRKKIKKVTKKKIKKKKIIDK
tara:strand:- start:734 stop:1096 length:363 start_codon:yes stop_codon:yes gene_type:complete